MSYAIRLVTSGLSLKNLRTKFLQFRRKFKISTQISLTYALILFMTLILTNVGTTAGVWYLFHHQAATAMDISIEKTLFKVRDLKVIDENIFTYDEMMSGVICRATDENNNLILDTNPSFAPTEKILQFLRKDSPFWSSKNYQLLETPHAFFYYKNIPVEVGGKIFQLQFFKSITFEKDFIHWLLWIILIVDLIGMTFAVMSGHILSKKILKPLRLVTATAQEISAGHLDRRIKMEKFGDEVSELADSFNKMLDKIEDNFIQQQRFISDASHEFRTPITIIRGYADMLESFGADDPDLLQEATIAIKSSSKNMQHLIESLLFLARADQNVLPLNKNPIEVNEMLKAIVESYNTPRLEFVHGKSFEFVGDANFLEKMFHKFIDNALNYSKDKVTVELQTFQNSATVKIIDRGIGIAEENHQKIFNRFFRVDKSRTQSDDENKFIGLGLSIAKWIADQHEIKIEIESELDKGTTIFCNLGNNLGIKF